MIIGRCSDHDEDDDWDFCLYRAQFARQHVDVQRLLSAVGHSVTLKSLKQQEQQYRAWYQLWLPAASILKYAPGKDCLSH